MPSQFTEENKNEPSALLNPLRIHLCVLARLLAFAAKAQNCVFVSGAGSDANPCTRTSPCRNFQRGHDAVVAGGEVVALDSAGYGKVTITKSVTITGDGVYAGITASSGNNGVTIATAGITVNLRSLTIEGLGWGSNGINATDFTTLHIENCIVNRFSNAGIRVQATAPGTRKVFIKDSIFKNNGYGINIDNNNSVRVLIATVEGTRTENNFFAGIFISGFGVTVTARDCLSSGNAYFGFRSDTGGVLNLESCVASNNDYIGIETNGSTARVSNSTVTNNTGVGFSNAAGTFESRGNNTVAGNNGGGAQTDGPITPLTAL